MSLLLKIGLAALAVGGGCYLAGKLMEKKDIEDSEEHKELRDEIQQKIRNDFGLNFSFFTTTETPHPDPDAAFNFYENIYLGVKSITKTEVRSLSSLSDPDRKVSAFEYRDIIGRQVLVLKRQLPTFDEDNRTSDSVHTLYVMHDRVGHTYGLYTTEGYSITNIYSLRKLLAADSKLFEALLDLGFPTDKISFV